MGEESLDWRPTSSPRTINEPEINWREIPTFWRLKPTSFLFHDRIDGLLRRQHLVPMSLRSEIGHSTTRLNDKPRDKPPRTTTTATLTIIETRGARWLLDWCVDQQTYWTASIGSLCNSSPTPPSLHSTATLNKWQVATLFAFICLFFFLSSSFLRDVRTHRHALSRSSLDRALCSAGRLTRPSRPWAPL